MRDWGLPLSQNVVKQVRRSSIRNERSRRLTLNEEQRLLDACDTGKIPLLRTLLIHRKRDAPWRASRTEVKRLLT